MNEQNSQTRDLERSLRALVEEDRRAAAPPHVGAAVMHIWDTVTPLARHRRRRRTRRVLLLAIGSAAAAAAAVVMMFRAPSGSILPGPIVPPAPEKSPVVRHLAPTDIHSFVEADRPRPRRPRMRGETSAPRPDRGLLLVADPILDASAASIVRVRVRRTALVTLGLPLVEPNASGWVDLEMLVGEDGVARTIRRAVPVSVRQE